MTQLRVQNFTDKLIKNMNFSEKNMTTSYDKIQNLASQNYWKTNICITSENPNKIRKMMT